MVLLTRKKQLAAVQQTDSSLPSGLDSASNADVIVLDLEVNVTPEEIERQLLSDTITPTKSIIGQKPVEMTFGVELKGTPAGTHAAGAPGWSKFLQACSMEQIEFQEITIGAISATGDGSSTTFRHNETITQATTGATARVVGDCHNGTTTLWIDKATVTGSPNNSNAWTGGDSGASATPSTTPADAGFAWAPVTDAVKSVTFDGTGLEDALAVGDVIEGTESGAVGIVTEAASVSTDTVVKFRPLRGSFTAGETMSIIAPSANVDTDIGDLADPTLEAFVQGAPLGMRARLDGKSTTARGCRGNVVFNFEVNRQGRMDFTFRGILSDTLDRTLISGIQYDNGNPPLFESASIGYARNDDSGEADVADEIAPCLRSASFDLGNQLADRLCAGASNGLLEVRVADRQGTGSMTVEDSLEADTAWLTALTDGRVNRLSKTLGGTDGNRFQIQAPGLQFNGATGGDEDGTATLDMSFRLTGGDLFDLDSGATVNSSIGGNNELILFYFTS